MNQFTWIVGLVLLTWGIVLEDTVRADSCPDRASNQYHEAVVLDSQRDTIALWDLKARKKHSGLQAKGSVSAVAISRDGAKLAGGVKVGVQVWNLPDTTKR